MIHGRLAHARPERDGLHRDIVVFGHLQGELFKIRRRGIATGHLALDRQFQPFAPETAMGPRGIQRDRLTVPEPTGPGDELAIQAQAAGIPARLDETGAVNCADLQRA